MTRHNIPLMPTTMLAMAPIYHLVIWENLQNLQTGVHDQYRQSDGSQQVEQTMD
jgi:hypothetical protein